MTIKPFWKFQAKNEAPLIGELLLYGDISSTTWWGDEVTPVAFAQDLKNLGDISQLNIYINSGGGDVFAGQAIYSMLKRHPAQKNVYIDGLAASIASVIAMAGDVVFMPKNAMLMIHKAWTMAIGNANDLRKLADDMDKIDESILTTYQAKTGLDPETITEMVNAETWLTADEAVKLGFADVIEDSKQVSASIADGQLMVNGQTMDLSRFRKTPQFVNKGDQPQVPQDPRIPTLEEPNEELKEEPNNQAVESKVAAPLPIRLPELRNSGRTISSTNEALIRQAMDCLAEVLGQLDNSDEQPDGDDMGMDGDGMGTDAPETNGEENLGEDDEDVGLFGVSLCQAQLNLTRRRLDYGF
ncbi:protease subunit of ATP-dependent protease [Desulfosporosinus acidiphilus SJ4]|uniref:ATP-dependent Clp protease proteolytic subunit n=1 Tax=Desulfosporosinus acidiphilus (strain DSM 22704 / JCM 16185 / SJ4) TaxID=646529 RepID=I4D3F2_DESAJ|nr:head maturation protease, ClpP-related [Desulfosporosinus acidiphilus]AFM40326.1 protease subunit of ATP-dependent protease [Desulfosporosinus acidiphilus SJ4]